jgi:hypothetical protein
MEWYSSQTLAVRVGVLLMALALVFAVILGAQLLVSPGS